MPEPNANLVHDLFVAVTDAHGHDVQIGQLLCVVMPLVERPLEAVMLIVQAAWDADCPCQKKSEFGIEAIVVLPTQYIAVAPLPPSSAEGPELCPIPRQQNDLDGAMAMKSWSNDISACIFVALAHRPRIFQQHPGSPVAKTVKEN